MFSKKGDLLQAMVLALSVHGPLSSIAFGLSIIMHPGRKNTVEENGRLQAKRSGLEGAKSRIYYSKALF